MKSLDLKKADFLANEIEYLNSYALSSGAAYFPPPIAANLSLDKIGYTSGLISKIDSEQRVATLMNGVLEKKRQEAYEAVKQYLESDRQAIIEAANTRLDLKSILENGRQAIIEAASLDLIPNTIHHYRPNSRRIGTQQPIKRPKTQENPNSYAKPSNTFEAKSKPEKPLSVDHSRLKRIAEHEKRYADLKNNVHPIMEIRQIVLLLIPEIDANQEREALAKAIIQSIQHGYLEFIYWCQGKESFIYRPFHDQVSASIHNREIYYMR